MFGILDTKIGRRGRKMREGQEGSLQDKPKLRGGAQLWVGKEGGYAVGAKGRTRRGGGCDDDKNR
jgi:hypothetical protein